MSAKATGSLGVVIVAAVLVGVPVGVLVAARSSPPAPHRVSEVALAATRLEARLHAAGFDHVHCGWAGSRHGPTTITCAGTSASASGALAEQLTVTVDAPPQG